jgi:hypothetical protein
MSKKAARDTPGGFFIVIPNRKRKKNLTTSCPTGSTTLILEKSYKSFFDYSEITFRRHHRMIS